MDFCVLLIIKCKKNKVYLILISNKIKISRHSNSNQEVGNLFYLALNPESLKAMANDLAKDFCKIQEQNEYEKKLVQEKCEEIRDLNQRIAKLIEDNKKLYLESQQLQQKIKEVQIQGNLTITQVREEVIQKELEKSRITEFKKQIEKLNQTINQLQVEVQSKEQSLNSLSKLNANLRKNEQTFNQQKVAYQADLDLQSCKNKELQQQLNQIQQQKSENEEEIFKLKEQVLKEIDRGQILVQQKEMAQNEMKETRNKNYELEEQLKINKLKCQELQNQKEKFEAVEQSQLALIAEYQVKLDHREACLKLSQDENKRQLVDIQKSQDYIQLLINQKNQIQIASETLNKRIKLMQNQNFNLGQNIGKLKESMVQLEQQKESQLHYKQEKLLQYELQIQNLQATIQLQEQKHRAKLQQFITIQQLQQNLVINNIKLKDFTQELQETWKQIFINSKKAREELNSLLSNLKINSKGGYDQQFLAQIQYLKDQQKDLINKIIALIDLISKKKISQRDTKDSNDLQQMIDFLHQISESHFTQMTQALKEMILHFIEASQKNSIFTCHQIRLTEKQNENIDTLKKGVQQIILDLKNMTASTLEQFLEMLRISILKLTEIINVIEYEGQTEFVQLQTRTQACTSHALRYLRNFLESIYNQLNDQKKLGENVIQSS